MAEERNIKIEDDKGNAYYPHTKASNVRTSDEKTVEEKFIEITTHLAEYAVQMATGTANAITVATGGDFKYKQGNRVSFKAISNSTGAVTINIDSKGNKALKKLDGTNATIKANKVYEIFYSVGDNCFFLLASAEGDAVAGNVLAGKYFSNDDDVGILGTMPNHGVLSQTLTTQGGQFKLPIGYIGGGSIKAQFANLTPPNIKAGVNVGGIQGTLEPMGTLYFEHRSVQEERVIFYRDGASILIVTSPSGTACITPDTGFKTYNVSTTHVKFYQFGDGIAMENLNRPSVTFLTIIRMT